jgi:hypothetical protein
MRVLPIKAQIGALMQALRQAPPERKEPRLELPPARVEL